MIGNHRQLEDEANEYRRFIAEGFSVSEWELWLSKGYAYPLMNQPPNLQIALRRVVGFTKGLYERRSA